ncbi:MAG TPA: acetyl-CoA C-acyltransferase, partial [Candidatus Dormibacteraeota bacterium]|nr:acetyl-CoA C-acyltransferase [Candidatus Dormibacteraeota bacterium]
MTSAGSVIVAGARTPFAKFGGAFKDIPAKSLGARAIRAALDRSGVTGSEVDYVIMGQVLQAGAG